jgi:hypothetical protein
MRRLAPGLLVAALALLAAGGAVATHTAVPSKIAPAIPGTTPYRCIGSSFTLFDSSNTQGVQNGGKPAVFSTKGKAYCVAQIVTYHWNNGQGATPGSIGLRVLAGRGGKAMTLGPLSATWSPGQGGAPNVNWTATAGVPLVINGSYSCQDSDPATWSQNQASGGRGFCTVSVTKAVPTAQPRPAAPAYTCSGSQLKLFDNSNGGGVINGANPPSFTTYGLIPGIYTFCLNSITTYHWNNGAGSPPGTIGLKPLNFGAIINPVPPRQATGSSGQGGAPNVNWTVNYGGAKPTIAGGAYACQDSSPATWSQNQQTKGRGFCIVYGTPAYVSSYTLPGGIQLAQPAPPAQPAQPPAPTSTSPHASHIKCFTGTLSSILLYPIHVPPGQWGLLLLQCGITQANGFTGRLAPSSIFVIDRGCLPFWTYPSASGNPPPPVFVHYTGQPGAPCSTAQIFVPFTVHGPWRVDYLAQDASSGTPLRNGAYALFVRYPGGDVWAQNSLNVP